MTHGRILALLAAASALAACGGSSNGSGMNSSAGGGTPDAGTVTTTSTDGGASDGGTSAASLTLTIKNMAFSPENLTVPAGATVQVVNDDGSTPHSVTSESTPGSYTPGAVSGISFDTGIFTGTKSFTIPAGAATGTVIPYYCRVHGPAMVDATKVQITIGTPSSTPNTAPSSPTSPPMPPPPGGY